MNITPGKQTDADKRFERILEGLKEASRRMVEEKRRKGELMVIMDKDGKIVKVKP